MTELLRMKLDPEPTREEITKANPVLQQASVVRQVTNKARFAVRLAWLLGFVGVVVTLLGFILIYINNPDRFIEFVPYPLQFLFFLIVGTIVASRRPENVISWIFLSVGLLNVLWVFADAYLMYAFVTQPGTLPISDWLIWLATGWIPGIGWGLMTTYGLLLFPTGRLLSRRWRPVAWVAAVALVGLAITSAFAPGPVDEERLGSVSNPFGVEALAGLGEIMLLLVLPVVGTSAVSVIVRFRRARGDERQQLKWFAYAAVFLLFTLCFSLTNEILGRPIPEVVIGLVFFCSVTAVPISVGISILKYRLYNIDLLINRTLVYVPLTAILAGIYAVLDNLLEELFLSITGSNSDGATVLTTLIIAVSFTPVKNGIQEFVDKRFKEAPDAVRKLNDLGQEVEGRIYPVSVRQVTQKLLERAVAAYGVMSGAIYLQQGEQSRLVHTWGDWKVDDTQLIIPLSCDSELDSELIGTLKLGPRRNRADYDVKDKAILQQVASVVAAAIKQDTEDHPRTLPALLPQDASDAALASVTEES